ncbi:MAG: hypothetical protein VB108_06975 [Anaerolineaceae bacterium]|nr:hypothetical protein [Anaerolineaceae bacterium]
MSALPKALLLAAQAVKAIWQDLWTMLAVNSLWVFSNLLVIPGPPATLALNAYANAIAAGEAVDHQDYWRYFIGSWKLGWRWGFCNLFILAILMGDHTLTSRAQDFPGKKILLGSYLALGLLWLLIQFFALPFLYEQKEKSLKQAWANSLVLMAKNPFFVLTLFITLGFSLLLSSLMFGLSLFFGAVFCSLLANFAVKYRLSPSSDVQAISLMKEKEDAL